MTTRSWSGGSGFWSESTQWIGGVAPIPGDSEIIGSGAVTMAIGGTIDAATIQLASSQPATLVASSTDFGGNFEIDSSGIGAVAALTVNGAVGYFGTIIATAPNGSFTLTTNAPAGGLQEFGLLGSGQMRVANGDTLILAGNFANHSTVTVGSGGTFINNGTIAQVGAAFEVEEGGTLAGSGVFNIGLFSSLYLQTDSAPGAQSVRFTDVGGRLLLASPTNYSGTVSNFQQGDLIDLTSTIADAATYDAATGLLSVANMGTVVATVHVQGPQTGAMLVQSDGVSGTLIEAPATLTRVKYTIAGDDRAMNAPQVRATMTTASGAAITGTGVRVGIISDSFDATAGIGAADPANVAAITGYLPLNATTNTCAVTVLSDAVGSGDDNEGMAMADGVYQVAPGAQLYFASSGTSLTSMASAVTSLQAVGCQVIMDDVTVFNSPFFQVAGPLDSAIETAMAAGVSYFTSAGNDGDASYQGAFNPELVTLNDGTQARAEIFGHNSPYQTVTLFGGVTTTIALQWSVPYGTLGSLLMLDLFSTGGGLVQQSRPVSGGATEETMTITPDTTTQYELAVVGSLPVGTTFKYILFGSKGGGSTAGGIIDDPAANGAGTVFGQAMVPGVNTVGAIEFADTPAFGAAAYYTDSYSANGPANILFDASGNALSPAQVETEPTIIAPVGSSTSVVAFPLFDGTSAAVPNAAAAAALMLQADPALAPAQVTSMLQQSADDLGLPANAEGAGLVRANTAVTLALGAGGASLASLAITATAAIQRPGQSNNAVFVFTVTRSGNINTAISADYTVAGSGADPATAADFAGGVLPTGTVSLAAGFTSGIIKVDVAGGISVPSNQGFIVTLSDPANATIGTASATGTILNNDTLTATTDVISAYAGILRTNPSMVLVNQEVAQIAAGSLALSQLDSQLISQAWSSTVPALITYDAFYGSIPAPGGLDYLANYAAALPAQGFSLLNVWVNLGASFAANGSFGAAHGFDSRDQFVNASYSSIFGQAPSGDALSTLVNSMDFYTSYAGSELGARGAVEGVMLYLAGQSPLSSFARAATNFLGQAANGTAHYQVELLGAHGS